MSARRATPEARCVWITREDVATRTPLQLARLARERWDAAPADPVEAVRVLVQTIASLRDPHDAIAETTDAICAVLGLPRQETPT